MKYFMIHFSCLLGCRSYHKKHCIGGGTAKVAMRVLIVYGIERDLAFYIVDQN